MVGPRLAGCWEESGFARPEALSIVFRDLGLSDDDAAEYRELAIWVGSGRAQAMSEEMTSKEHVFPADERKRLERFFRYENEWLPPDEDDEDDERRHEDD